MKAILISGLLFCVGVSALADDQLNASPGYFDFDQLTVEYGEPRVMVDLGSTLLNLISHLKHDDPVASEVLSQLEHVRVRVYSTAGDTAAAAAQATTTTESLNGLEWEKIVQVREPDNHVDVYVKAGPEMIYGLLVMKVDSDEAVFVNVLGDIQPEKLSAVLEHVNLDIDLDLDADAAP